MNELARRRESLSNAERKQFVDANPLIKDWLRNKAPGSQRIYAFHFIRFFRWAQTKYGFASPDKMIEDHVASLKSDSIQQRKKHARIVKEYVLDNPEFTNLSDSAKALMITSITSFYNYCEVPLTKATGEFKLAIYAKYEKKQFGLDDARRIIDAAPQREKTIFLIMLQAGLRIGDLLNYVNYRWSEIAPQLKAGRDPVKLSMYGQKYWTYFTSDAIQELRKYIIERGEPKEGEAIFVSRSNKAVSPVYVADVLQRIGLQLGLIPESEMQKLSEGHRYPIDLHQFRKLFKSESSVAGRGFDSRYGEFFMGHAGGLAQIGGVYDKSPELHEDIFEKEYMKLSPYLNIFTGVQTLEKRVAEMEKLKEDLGPEMVERLRKQGLQFRGAEAVKRSMRKKKKDCENNEHCAEFKQVNETELLEHLKQGWQVVHNLANGELIVSRGDKVAE